MIYWCKWTQDYKEKVTGKLNGSTRDCMAELARLRENNDLSVYKPIEIERVIH